MENSRLLRKIANSFALSTGVEFDDLYQEASLAYLEALRTHDPQKGRITTYLWHVVSNRLKSYIREEELMKCRKHDGKLHYFENMDEIMPEVKNAFWENLTKEAQDVAKLVISSPMDFVNLDSVEVQKKVIETMLNKGVDFVKICRGIKSLKKVYS